LRHALLLAALATATQRTASAAPTALANDTARVVVAAAAADSLTRTVAPATSPAHSGLLRADRLQHATLSLAIASGARSAGARRPAAFAITLAVGAAKETRDVGRGGFDAVDLVADALGAALGAWLAGLP